MDVPALRFELDPALTPELRAGLLDCWVETTNAGGSIGFVAPVGEDDHQDEITMYLPLTTPESPERMRS